MDPFTDPFTASLRLLRLLPAVLCGGGPMVEAPQGRSDVVHYNFVCVKQEHTHEHTQSDSGNGEGRGGRKVNKSAPTYPVTNNKSE